MTKFKPAIKRVLPVLAAFFIIALIISNSTTVLKAAYPLKYEDYVYKYSVENCIDPYLVFAIIKAESSFDSNARSHREARGLMQISQKTGIWASEVLRIDGFSVETLYEPEINIRIGCWYISNLMREFDNNLDLTIAAYNGGSGNVKQWLRNKDYSRTGTDLHKIPFKETDKYLKRVKNYYFVYKSLYDSK